MIKPALFERIIPSLFICTAFLVSACEDEEIPIEPQPLRVATYTQVDRIGIPGLNTVFNHPDVAPFEKLPYNIADPKDDFATYQGPFEIVLGAVANADPSTVAGLFLPDELPVNLGSEVSNFGLLDGRKLEDDAIDVALSVIVGVPSLQSDNLDANDVPFLDSFPYLANPN